MRLPNKTFRGSKSDNATMQFFLRARADGMTLAEAASMFKHAKKRLEEDGDSLYGRILVTASDAEASISDPHEREQRTMVILASNNYLGLTTHHRVIQAALETAPKYGTGAGSSPLLVGTFPTTKELEARLAEFKRCEAACLFPCGYSANVGVISAVAGKGDLIVLDRLAHASMVDGAKLAGAHVKVFRHNDADHLDHVLRRNADARTKLVSPA
jgi:glycine C-acetyltransferase